MFRSIFAIALYFLYLVAPAQNRQTIDSLQKVLQKRITDTGRIHTLILLADDYATLEANDSAKIYIDLARKLNSKYQVIEFKHLIDVITLVTYCSQNPQQDYTAQFLPILADCRRTGDKNGQLRTLTALAGCTTPDRKSNDLKISYYQEAAALSRELHKPQEFYCMRQIADIHFQQLKYDQAEKELYQILNDPRAGDDDKLYSTDLLTAVYTARAQYDKALLFATKTIKIMQATKDSSTAITFYSRLAYIHFILGNDSLHRFWTRMALNNAIVIHRPEFIYGFLSNICKSFLQENKAHEALKFISGMQVKYKPLNGPDSIILHRILGNCYLALKKHRLAETNYLKTLTINRGREADYDFNLNTGTNLKTIADFYLKTGQYVKAKQYLLQSLKHYELAGKVNFLQSVYFSLFQADSALTNYQAAISHLQASNKLRDSMFNVAKNKQIEELNIAYQTEEKEKALLLMRSKEKLEQEKLQHAEITRDWIIGGSGLLMIIVMLLYRQSILRKRNNKMISHKNELLQHLLKEKEWLLKEVHHRVKNNLHTVICLLESQARYLENDALQAIETSQQRIYAMSLIHQKLYQSEDIKTINMATYIPELVQSLTDSFGTAGRVHFKLNIEPIDLSLSHAIPLALIINEVVTNSIKYAFPDHRKGEILISMKDNGKQIVLEMADNGIGMPTISYDAEPESFGLRLIKGLSEDIEAETNFEVDNGTRITIAFSADPLNTSESILTSANTTEVYV
jgi:two-component sensor histidine kinase